MKLIGELGNLEVVSSLAAAMDLQNIIGSRGNTSG
jgi:hypothetical protein